MSNVFTGQVTGISKIAGGAPAAFCRAVTGGRFRRTPHNVRQAGIGGQLHVRKGTDEVELQVNCVGVVSTDLALWFPTTITVQVADFPDFLVEVDDGVNGQEFVLSGGQPDTCRIRLSGGPAAEVEYGFTMKFKTVTEQAAGTATPVYNSLLGHTVNDVAVSFTGAAQGLLSFDLTQNLGLAMHNPADGKTAGSRTVPDGYYVTRNEVRFSCVTSNVFRGAEMDGDTWEADDNLDVVLALTNGTAAEDLTLTLSQMVTEGWNMPVEAEGITGFQHEFAPGNGTSYNRVLVA